MSQDERDLHPGEPVAWSYGAAQARGHVVEKITEDKKIGSRVFKASPDDPRYVVKSDSSGKEAVRKPETLHKLHEDEDADVKSVEAELDGEDVKNGVGVKEKRDDLEARSTVEEREEAQHEENLQKVQDTGKGSVRASTEASQNELMNGLGKSDAQERAEEEDAIREPDRSELQVPNGEEAIGAMPSEVHEEGAKISDDTKSELISH